jgi:hypothetical protein
MYILAKPNNTPVYPYSFGQLRKDNPNISFSTDMTDEEYAKYHVYRVVNTAKPSYDVESQRVAEATPILSGGAWAQTWKIVNLTDAEKSAVALSKQQQVNQEAMEYLASTDWYVTRKSETGQEIPADVLNKRAAARLSIKNGGPQWIQPLLD